MALRFVVSLTLISILSIGHAMSQSKPFVAVLGFSDPKVRGLDSNHAGVRQELGNEISNMLERRLVDDGSYRVLDNQAVDRIASEKNFSFSDGFDAVKLAKLTTIFGVDAAIIGEVTISGADEQALSSRVPVSPVNSGPLASIKIRARLIQAKTGKRLASAIGLGTASSFKESSIEQAVKTAVDQIAATMIKEAPSVHGGQIADVSSGEVILNVGSDQSLKVGDTVSVMRATRATKDPAIGSTQRTIESELGTVKITSVDPSSATGTFSGDVNPKVGDSLRWISSPTSEEAPAEGPTGPTKQPDGNNAVEPIPPQSPASAPTSSSGVPTSINPPVFPQHPPSSPLPGTPPEDEYSLGKNLENWKKTLRAGAVEYRVPGEMTASVPATVTVNLHGYQDLENRALPEATGTGSLQVSSHMKVELFAPLDPGEFKITQSSGEAEQFIPNDGYATWIWSVTPAHAAPSEMLRIRISLIHKDATNSVEQILEEKTYSVSVNVEKLSVTLKQSFWKDPIAWFKYMLPGGAGWGAVAALFTWIGGLAWWKNRKKRSKRRIK